MASFRKKPSAIEQTDAPVAPAPQAIAAELPPVSETPSDEPLQIETLSAVDKAGQDALRARLREMENAQALRQQAAQPPPPPPPQHANEPPQYAAPEVPAAVQRWVDAHSEYFSDPIAQAELNVATLKCARAGVTWNDDNYIPSLERHLRGQATNGHAEPRSERILHENSIPPPTPSRPAALPPQRQSVMFSAPPTREPPSFSTGRPAATDMRPTASDHEGAQIAGITVEEYLRQKKKALQAGVIGPQARDGR